MFLRENRVAVSAAHSSEYRVQQGGHHLLYLEGRAWAQGEEGEKG